MPVMEFERQRYPDTVIRSIADSDLDPECCWLVATVALAVEASPAQRPSVSMSLDELMRRTRISSERRLRKARATAIAAGWLMYTRPGWYRATIPRGWKSFFPEKTVQPVVPRGKVGKARQWILRMLDRGPCCSLDLMNYAIQEGGFTRATLNRARDGLREEGVIVARKQGGTKTGGWILSIRRSANLQKREEAQIGPSEEAQEAHEMGDIQWPEFTTEEAQEAHEMQALSDVVPCAVP